MLGITMTGFGRKILFHLSELFYDAVPAATPAFQSPQVIPGEWPETPSPVSPPGHAMAEPPPVHFSRPPKNPVIRNERLSVIPARRRWPSWYQLESKRKATGLDYPSSDEAEEDERQSQVLVRLSRRGEVYLQTRLQEALAEGKKLQEKVDSYEAELEYFRTLHMKEVMKTRAYFDQAVQQNQAQMKSQAQEFEQVKRGHQQALEDLRNSHKTQLNELIESNITLIEDLEKEHEEEIIIKDERIKQLEYQYQSRQNLTTYPKDLDKENEEEIIIITQNKKDERIIQLDSESRQPSTTTTTTSDVELPNYRSSIQRLEETLEKQKEDNGVLLQEINTLKEASSNQIIEAQKQNQNQELQQQQQRQRLGTAVDLQEKKDDAIDAVMAQLAVLQDQVRSLRVASYEKDGVIASLRRKMVEDLDYDNIT